MPEDEIEPEPQVTYDRQLLYEELDKVQNYLAELRYIDTGMAFMEEVAYSGWRRMITHTITVKFGWTYEFEKDYGYHENEYRLPWQDSEKDKIFDRLGELKEQSVSWAATEIESIKSRIEPFTYPVGSVYGGQCVRPVVAAYERLEDTGEIETDLALLWDKIANWEGDAASEFNTHFYMKYPGMVKAQRRLLATLADGIAVAQAIAESTQHSLMGLASYMKTALKEQLELAAATAERERSEPFRVRSKQH